MKKNNLSLEFFPQARAFTLSTLGAFRQHLKVQLLCFLYLCLG